MPVQNLPQELLLNTFRQTAEGNLQERLRVCKLWHSVALQEFYGEVKVDNINVFQLEVKLFSWYLRWTV